MSFGDDLRAAREERGLTLRDLAARTKIKTHLLADLEDDDLSRWPAYLVYRHGYVRSIAEALGLDPDAVLDRFDETFPEYAPVAFDRSARTHAVKNRALSVVSLTLRAAAGVVVGAIAGFLLSASTQPREMTRDHVTAVADRTPEPATLTTVGVNEVPPPDTDAVHAVNAVNADEGVMEGEVLVVSNPPAFVTVNGIGRGRTPARVRYLPLGAYTVRVIQDGYSARESRVVLTPDRPIRKVRLALRAR